MSKLSCKQHIRQFGMQYPNTWRRYQKKALKTAKSKNVIINPRVYKVDGEVGRFEFQTHSVVDVGDDESVLFDTSVSLFTPLRGKEFYRTVGFKEIAYIFGGTEKSFRRVANGINRFRHQEAGGTPPRTLHENTVKEGAHIIDYLDKTSKCVLERNDFSSDGQYTGQKADYYSKIEPICLKDQDISEMAGLCYCPEGYSEQDLLDNPVLYENQADSADICIDDVVVKKQEENRSGNNSTDEKKRKYVHNTVAHIVSNCKKYTLNGYNTVITIRYLLAFLLNNNLVNGTRLQFFTDGHRALNSSIFKSFSWYNNIGLILDWYHLQKKCKEKLSMAMKGSKIRNKLLVELMPLLWHGLSQGAIDLLNNTDASLIKNNQRMTELIEYIERNRPYIPCYAIRKRAGLRNSSALGEKMNHLVVAERQKHNGMSWSKTGSMHLAAVTTLKRNREGKKWFEEKNLEFKLIAA